MNKRFIENFISQALRNADSFIKVLFLTKNKLSLQISL